jgi:Fur family zinc uptake transcriptional regulator
MPGMQSRRVIREVEQRCKRDHLRLTPTRRRVLELVLEADGPVKAYDLLDRLKSEQPNAAPPTIYRALEFLLEHHFIHRLETMNAFVSCFHPEDQHQGQFLICEHCGHVTEVAEDTLSDDLERVARDADFSPNRQVLEVYGTCGDCRRHREPSRG